MRLRDHFQHLRQLRSIATAAGVPSEPAHSLRPFTQHYAPLPLTRAAEPQATFPPHTQHAQIVSDVQAAALALQRRGIKGLCFHNQFQRQLAERAPAYHLRGFTECAVTYHAADRPCDGRMDVVWADPQRIPTVLFEIDSTVKAASLEKLLLASAPFKYWVYFGPDVWKFKTFLAKADLRGSVRPIVISRFWTPVSAAPSA